MHSEHSDEEANVRMGTLTSGCLVILVLARRFNNSWN
jgi:hypothetical protein